jgi:hypothetical protein
MAAQPEIPTPWIGIEDLPVHFANAFGVTPAPNAIFLMLGSVTPLGGDPSGQVYAPVRPIARVAIAPAALPGLIDALNDALRLHNEQSQSTL